jgi:hypothetical protein
MAEATRLVGAVGPPNPGSGLSTANVGGMVNKKTFAKLLTTSSIIANAEVLLVTFIHAYLR